MTRYAFETVDVFTDRAFGGNPLAVFTDAQGLTGEQMQALAREFNLSETVFILPPEDPANTARVRIFHPTDEMPFAGHPSIGAGYVLARLGRAVGGVLRFEMIAGLVIVTVQTSPDGEPVGASVAAPQPLRIGTEVAPEVVAACAGLSVEDVIVTRRPPVAASVGAVFVCAEVREEALARCVPDVAAFHRAIAAYPEVEGRFSLHLYARDANRLHVRMFAPLAGTWEDPATGSANCALSALLLHVDGGEEARFEIHQGAEMGRPSLLIGSARRAPDGLRASIAGGCVPMFTGSFEAR